MGNEGYVPLFETKKAQGIALYRLFAASVFVGICFIWAYRVNHIPRNGEDGRWVWIGLFAAEVWFGFYWLLTQALRWNPIYRHTFKDRLSRRFHPSKNSSYIHCTLIFALLPRSPGELTFHLQFGFLL